MKKIKAVIFDLDGTLANTLPLCIQAFRRSVEPLPDRSVSNEEIIATFGQESRRGCCCCGLGGNFKTRAVAIK